MKQRTTIIERSRNTAAYRLCFNLHEKINSKVPYAKNTFTDTQFIGIAPSHQRSKFVPFRW